MSISRQARIREQFFVSQAETEADSSAEFFEPDAIAENPPCRRSDGETSRVLRLLDEIGKEQG